MFCKYCGGEVVDDAVVCVHCGRALDDRFTPSSNADQSKTGVIVLILCIFTGFLGIHRFYTGHIATGIVQLLTCGGCGIWVLVDLILIVTGSFKDNDGREIIL